MQKLFLLTGSPTASSIIAVVAAMAMLGCGPDQPRPDQPGPANGSDYPEFEQQFDSAELSNEEDAANAAAASAPNHCIAIPLLPTVTVFEVEEGADCPDIQTDSETGELSIIGDGCTDEAGNTWGGSANNIDASENAIVFPGDSEFPLEAVNLQEAQFNDYYTEGEEECPDDETITAQTHQTVDGSVSIEQLDDAHYECVVELESQGVGFDDDCNVDEFSSRIEYRGEVEMHEFDDDGAAVAHSWSGDGARGSTDFGWARLETIDQQFDVEQCDYKPLSGSTVATAGDTELEVRYDGEENCDPAATATWYLDGEERGTLEDVHCSSTGGASGLVAIVMVLVMLMVARVRKRQA